MPKSFDFEVSLRGARPKVWRRFLLKTGASFFDLHESIQRACGWWDYHLFVFRGVPSGVAMCGVPDDEYDDTEMPDARDVKLDDYFGQGRKKAEYEYDFGDGWIHDVKLLGVVEHEVQQKRKLLGGARAFPHEDCGGFDGYLRCAAFVKTGRDPYDEGDDQGLGRWLGGWHPDHFDFEATAKKFDTKPPRRSALITQTPPLPSPSPAVEPRTNSWCDALGIDVPDVAAVAQKKGHFGAAKLSELVVIALLAEGQPLSEDDVVSRLTRAGISTGIDLSTSLKRSLASGRAPLLRDHEGRLIPDLKSHEMDMLLFSLKLLGPRSAREAEEPKAIETTSPLTAEELDAVYQGRIASGDTKARFMLAVLDVERRPMSFQELAERWGALGGDAKRFSISNSERALLKKRSDLVVDGDTVRLVDDADLSTMREAIRKRARSVLSSRANAARHETWKATHEVEERERYTKAAQMKRCVIVSKPRADAPALIEGFDFSRSEARSFGKDALAAFADWVKGFDIVGGARPVQTLGATGVDIGRFAKVVDLLPVQKTRSVDGLQLPITWDAIVTATLGPTAEPMSLATMVALYRYALLHTNVWIVLDGIRVALPIDAHVRGDRGVYEVMRDGKEARERGETAPIVSFFVGHAPEVLPPSVKPLNVVVRGRVVDYGRGNVVLIDESGRERVIALNDISSIDVTGGNEFAWRLPVTWSA